jgi:DNA-directed RNA polymerase specialized sigma24 family protein
MQYHYNPDRDDVEYFEPFVEPKNSDIADFILGLDEPQRSICSAVVLDGENIGTVAAAHNLTRRRIGKILRSSLRPLAEEFEIIPQ